MARCDTGVFDQVDNLFGNHPGLAGAGAGQHQQWSIQIAYRFQLERIEVMHKNSGRFFSGVGKMYRARLVYDETDQAYGNE